jgi:hypothetical protein
MALRSFGLAQLGSSLLSSALFGLQLGCAPLSPSLTLPVTEVPAIQGGSRSPVAQLVERVTVNHLVAGSSPARGAILDWAPFGDPK